MTVHRRAWWAALYGVAQSQMLKCSVGPYLSGLDDGLTEKKKIHHLTKYSSVPHLESWFFFVCLLFLRLTKYICLQ